VYTRRRETVRNTFLAVVAASVAIVVATLWWTDREVATADAEVATASNEVVVSALERNRARGDAALAAREVAAARVDAEQLTVDADEQQKRSRQFAELARTQEERANEERIKAKELSEKNQDLEADNIEASARLEITRNLASDPAIAYRLAEYAYKHLKSGPANRRDILRAASRARFAHQARFPGCHPGNVAAPFLLLHCSDSSAPNPDREIWKVVHLPSGEIRGAVPAVRNQDGTVWVVPHAGSWQLVVDHVVASPANRDPDREVLFLNDAGQVVRRVPTKGAVDAQLCGPDRLLVNRYSVGVLSWLNLHTGDITPVPIWKWLIADPPFLNSCSSEGRLLVTSGDEVAVFEPDQAQPAIHHDGILPRWLSASASATWSPDRRFVAINDSGQAGVLDLKEGTFHLLPSPSRKPDFQSQPSPPNRTARWLTTAQAWEDSRTLVVAGHTANMADYTLSTLDVLALEDGHKNTQAVDQLVMDVAVLPDGGRIAAYSGGRIKMSPGRRGEIAWSGQQPGVASLAVEDRVLVSYSSPHVKRVGGGIVKPDFDDNPTTEVRLWHLNRMATGWVFRSTLDRKYKRCSAGDRTYRWHAVAFTEGDTAGVEVRAVDGSGSTVVWLPASVSQCRVLAFSADGQWLAAAGRDSAHIIATSTWTPYTLEWAAPVTIGWLSVEPGRIGVHSISSLAHSYSIDLSGSAPRMVSRPVSPTSVGECSAQTSDMDFEGFSKHVVGWQSALSESPADSALIACRDSGWVQKTLLLQDGIVDVEFIPVDEANLMRVYDGMMPRIPTEQLKLLIEASAAVR
jgi:hypothetical protein